MRSRMTILPPSGCWRRWSRRRLPQLSRQLARCWCRWPSRPPRRGRERRNHPRPAPRPAQCTPLRLVPLLLSRPTSLTAYDLAGVQTAANYGARPDDRARRLLRQPDRGAADLQFFHDTFYPEPAEPELRPGLPAGQPGLSRHVHGNGLSGPTAAAGWAGEATLDIEWAYAIAPLAHIVLVAVPPAETEGVQGFPNLFKAISGQIDANPGRHRLLAELRRHRADVRRRRGACRRRSSMPSSRRASPRATRSSPRPVTTARSASPSSRRTPRSTRSRRPAGRPRARTSRRSAGRSSSTAGHGTPRVTPRSSPTARSTRPTSRYTTGGNTEGRVERVVASRGDRRRAERDLPAADLAVRRASAARRPSRVVPDLSWNAAVNGGVARLHLVLPERPAASAGTSTAAPARPHRRSPALIALANAEQAAASEPPIGDVAPFLYSSHMSASDFTDIVSVTEGTALSGVLADNTLWQYNADGSVSAGPVPGYPLQSGWDMATGFGSPIGAPFVADLRAARNAP